MIHEMRYTTNQESDVIKIKNHINQMLATIK